MSIEKKIKLTQSVTAHIELSDPDGESKAHWLQVRLIKAGKYQSRMLCSFDFFFWPDEWTYNLSDSTPDNPILRISPKESSSTAAYMMMDDTYIRISGMHFSNVQRFEFSLSKLRAEVLELVKTVETVQRHMKAYSV